MTFIGNLFLVFAALIFGRFFSSVYVKKIPAGSDGLAGYLWGIIFLHLAFLACMAVAAIAIGLNGGFDWISPRPVIRYLIVGLGLPVMLLTAASSALFKEESGPVTAMIRLFSGFAPVLIPIVLVVEGFILLNDGLREAAPSVVYTIPLAIVLGLGILGVFALLNGFIVEARRNARRRIESLLERQDQNHLQLLRDIESCDVSKDMVFILVLSDHNQDADVRQKAVAKIKTNPHWQQELIRILGTGWVAEAFTFLASNEVEDKNLFLEPVRKGVLIQAKLIGESVHNSTQASDFYPERFSWEVERLLRTVDKFEGFGIDYRPAVRELRTVLDDLSRVEKIKLNCLSILDNWLKRRQ